GGSRRSRGRRVDLGFGWGEEMATAGRRRLTGGQGEVDPEVDLGALSLSLSHHARPRIAVALAVAIF
uniref:Uncharacterized protein n=1 Tax=Oryza brachyantha TaxID=4533 RepID=J3L8S6_ORYBR